MKDRCMVMQLRFDGSLIITSQPHRSAGYAAQDSESLLRA